MNETASPLQEPKEPIEITSLLSYKAKLQADVDSLRKNADMIEATIKQIDQAVALLRNDVRLIPFVQIIIEASKKLRLS